MSEIYGSGAEIDAEASLRTLPLPTILWIELTSRCPFDCVFCSRRLLRGNGMHMDFALYARLIGQLRDPQTIRLNYSGESVHYPHLVEACRLAAETGAAVELVTALAALPESKLEPLARSGLSNLTVSLHTLDPVQFGEIYKFGRLETMRGHIERLQELAPHAPRRLDIDFAFVAMRRNLDQLLPVVRYADSLGLERVCVHPVIRRDPIEETFPEELDNGRLRPGFIKELERAVEEARSACPAMNIEVSTPELDGGHRLDANPRYHPGALPKGARIAGCDQDPWQTVHVLADGRVVSCEVRDQIVLGSLAESSLAEIWHSRPYREFRRAYLLAEDAKCRNCAYKLAYVPGPIPSRIVPGVEGTDALLSGWYAAEQGWAWSGQRGTLRLNAKAGEEVRLRVLMPPAWAGTTHLDVDVNGRRIGRVSHSRAKQREFSINHRIAESGSIYVELSVDRVFRPSDRGDSSDGRELGVALLEAKMSR